MAKLFTAETAIRTTDQALQIFGGAGYVRDPDNNIERYYRDARITAIYEGTSEAQKIVISRSMLNE
jgi:alkylation response protein AidB-like acyl-CoA dehydrogenase